MRNIERGFKVRCGGAVAADAGGQPTDNVVCRDAHRGDCIQFGPFAFAAYLGFCLFFKNMQAAITYRFV